MASVNGDWLNTVALLRNKYKVIVLNLATYLLRMCYGYVDIAREGSTSQRKTVHEVSLVYIIK